MFAKRCGFAVHCGFAKRGGWLMLAVVCLCAGTRSALASPPWAKMVLFKHLEADPNEMYPITDASGPWMIMATSFTGDGAEEQARQLIHELRSQYKLPAYSYQKKFDYTKPVEGKGFDPNGQTRMMRYQRGENVVEIAVLVGDYSTVDDPEGQKVLKKLKLVQPKTLAVDAEKTSQSLATFRDMQKQVKENMFAKNSDELKRGPMANAFVITNPILPAEYFVPKGVDKFVIEMNKNVTHSLVRDCKERYTVKVATFTGHALILDQKRIDSLARGEEPKSYLEDAAKKAHLLTEALRKKGYDAYEFHDRNSSIVTIGAFASVGNRLPDGRIDLNPSIHTIMRTFGAETKTTPGKATEVGKAKKLAGIPFDVQPMPVEVPQWTISSDYSRTAAVR